MKRAHRASGPGYRAAGMGAFCRLWVAFAATVLLLGGCAQGTYRMPYSDGTNVVVTADHVTHTTPVAYMYDIVAQNASPAEIVAAAPGWVRFIDDWNQEPTNTNNFVWIEHPYPFCPLESDRSNWPGKPDNYDQICILCNKAFCNEWTVYAHFTKNSVRVDAGLTEGDWVEAGQFLGFESNVGDATGVHLHWHVAVIPPNEEPSFNGYYLDYVNEVGKQPELIPIVCHQGGEHVLWKNGNYTAGDCAAAAPLPRRGFASTQRLGRANPRSPINFFVQRIAQVSDEALAIARGDGALMRRSLELLMRLEPAFEDLRHLGRARISSFELKQLQELLSEYQARGSDRMRRALVPLVRRLTQPDGPSSLGLVVTSFEHVLD